MYKRQDDFLYRNNAAYRADLDKKGYKYEFMETPGGHVWTCWRIYLSVFAVSYTHLDVYKRQGCMLYRLLPDWVLLGGKGI